MTLKPPVRRILEVLLVLAIVGVGGALALHVVSYVRAPVQLRDEILVSPEAAGSVREETIPDRPHRIADLLRDPKSIRRWRTFRYTTNSLGLRGREVARQKTPGTLRIAAVGDCVTWGGGVADDEAWPARLERSLSARRSVEVLNAGVPNAPSAVLSMLETRVIGLEPDLVLFTPGSPHIFAAAHVGQGPQRVRLPDDEVARLVADLRAVVSRGVALSREHGFRLVILTGTFNSFVFPDTPIFLDATLDQARREGIPVLDTSALFLPLERRDGMVFERDDTHQRLVRDPDGARRVLFETANVGEDRWVAAETYRWLDDHPGEGPRYFVDENHLNADGQALLADAVLAFLDANGLIAVP